MSKTNIALNGKTYNDIERVVLDNKIFKYAGQVPSGYQVIKGIKNLSGAYIDTGIKVLNTDTIEISFNFDDASTAFGFIMGWRTSGATSDGYQCGVVKSTYVKDNSGVYPLGHLILVGKAARTDNIGTYTDVFNDDDQTVTIDFANQTIKVNGVLVDVPADFTKPFVDGSSVYNPALFALSNIGAFTHTRSFGNTYLYGFSVIRNNEHIVEMIPVKKSDGTIGMYDIARDQFFGSATANAFTE